MARKLHNRKFWKNFRHLNKIREGVGGDNVSCVVRWFFDTQALPWPRPPRARRGRADPSLDPAFVCTQALLSVLCWLFLHCFGCMFVVLCFLVFDLFSYLRILTCYFLFFCIIRCFMFKICIFDAFLCVYCQFFMWKCTVFIQMFLYSMRI